MPRLTLHAHAKINLALSLGPPEPPTSNRPGWHPICTWMHAIDLSDTLTLEPLDADAGSTLHIDWAPDAPRPSPIDWTPRHDLTLKALHLLEIHTGQPLPTRITLSKRIPVASGLGGGSSDAAATLIGLNHLWNLHLHTSELAELALSLGSDCPFFIDHHLPPPEATNDPQHLIWSIIPRPAIVESFGDQCERCSPLNTPILLLLPNFGCETRSVYHAFDTMPRTTPPTLRTDDIRSLAQPAPDWPARLFNDLTRPACHICPQLDELIKHATHTLNLPVHMSGSGSTLFVVHHDPPHARQLTDTIQHALPQLAVLPTKLCKE